MWQLSFPVTLEQEALELARQGPEALHRVAVERCSTWHTPIPVIMEVTPVSLISGYPVYDRAVLEPRHLVDARVVLSGSSTSRGVTLVGDACHPMTPFKGQGANQALLDSKTLSCEIYRQCGVEGRPLHSALVAFEEEMLRRTTVKVEASAEAAEFLHSPVAFQEGNVTRGAMARSVNGCEEDNT